MTRKNTSPSRNSFLEIDYNFMMAEAIGPEFGLTPKDLDSLKESLDKAHEDITGKRKNNQLSFMDLPFQASNLKLYRGVGEKVYKKYENFVVLGIGGSALGTKAVFNALCPLNHNFLSNTQRRHPKLFVADNIDPEGFAALLEIVDPRCTVFNVISKSGSTAETMSQFMIIHQMIQKSLGKSSLKDHLIITTDPKNGVLRQIVADEGLTSFEVPSDIGGRFSVLTSVSLLPLAVAGVNIAELLKGAAEASKDCQKTGLKNPAYLFAGLNYLMNVKQKRPILVMMPYADSLSLVADWFLQLWGESLGKAETLDGEKIFCGQTALKALGATDQHSQLQLYMEGPQDKTICFLGLESYRNDIKIPTSFKKYPALSYLGGHTLEELILAEQKATAKALAMNGRPNLTLTIPKLSPTSMGYLLYVLEVATVTSGALYNIDPLNQPGVELSKKFTYGLLGHKDFKDFKEKFDKGPASKKKYILG